MTAKTKIRMLEHLNISYELNYTKNLCNWDGGPAVDLFSTERTSDLVIKSFNQSTRGAVYGKEHSAAVETNPAGV